MQWDTILTLYLASGADETHASKKRLLAQLIAVRMVLFQGKDCSLDYDDWESLLRWLSLKVPSAGKH